MTTVLANGLFNGTQIIKGRLGFTSHGESLGIVQPDTFCFSACYAGSSNPR